MAIKQIRIDYTVYSPDYEPGEGLRNDFPTLERAKRSARDLGTGSVIVRNFNQTDKDGGVDWWQVDRCWYFAGLHFRRASPSPRNKSHPLPMQLDGNIQFRRRRALTRPV